MTPSTLSMRAFTVPLLVAATSIAAQQPQSLPLRQSALDSTAVDARYIVPLDSTADQRWLGGGATTPRWDVQGQWAYFQFALDPKPVVGPFADDPWWRVSRDGKRVEQVDKKDALAIPTNVQYTRDGKRAVYFNRGELRYWKPGVVTTKLLASGATNIFARWNDDEKEVRYTDNNQLYAIDPETGTIRQLTRTFAARDPERPNKLKDELKKEQLALFDVLRRNKDDRDSATARQMREGAAMPIATPAKATERVSQIAFAPKGDYVTYLVTPRSDSTPTVYVDYVTESGYAEQKNARPKVGDPGAATRGA